MKDLSEEIYKAHLEEYFQVNIGNYIKEITKIYYLLNFDRYNKFRSQSKSIKELLSLYNNSEFEIIMASLSKLGHCRNGLELNIEFVSNLLYSPEISESTFISNFVKTIKQVNLILKNKVDVYLKNAITNLRTYIKEEFIDAKFHKVTIEKKFVENYFTVFERNNPSLIFLNSGDTHYNNMVNSFCFNENWDLLQRNVIMNKNSILIRYPHDNYDNFIYQYMSIYMENVASIAEGVNIESITSVPVFALNLLISRARKVNPNLLVFANISEELLDTEQAHKIISEIGVNYIIRDIEFNDPSQWKEMELMKSKETNNTKFLYSDKKTNKVVLTKKSSVTCSIL